ncbi:MAG TPA: crossover junction endodeoxyribonuclease RuvC [Clostridia bacterium]|nr:crossover junction endodeoxyribonuclease RuvC [Clostridia bacterium]
MKILGIDPGTATVGIGVIECDGKKISSLHQGWIKTSKKDSPQKRLAQIHAQTRELIQTHRPDILAIERLFFFINYKTAMSVAESIGVIKLAAETEGLEIVSLAPLEIKCAVTGNGKAPKKEIKAAVRKILGVRAPKNKKTHFDDLCDALAVAICYAQKYVLAPSPAKVRYNKVKKKTGRKKGYRGITKRRVEDPPSHKITEGKEGGEN